MSEAESISFSIELNTENCYTELRKIETILYRSMALLRRFTGDENLDAAIIKIQRLITTVRAAQLAIRALQMASGPIGWAYAGVSVLSAMVIAADTISSYEVTSH